MRRFSDTFLFSADCSERKRAGKKTSSVFFYQGIKNGAGVQCTICAVYFIHTHKTAGCLKEASGSLWVNTYQAGDCTHESKNGRIEE